MGSRSPRCPDTTDDLADVGGVRPWAPGNPARSGVAVVAVLALAGCHGGEPRAGAEQSTVAPGSATSSGQEPPTEAGELRLTLALDRTVDLGVEVTPGHLVASDAVATTTEVASRGGGRITVTSGPTGAPALRFPEFSRAIEAPAAAITVTSTTSSWMNPGSESFRFGADVVLDERSWGSERDNGDNVLQRGLHDDASQFKLQLDRRRPSCTLKGDAGTVYLGADDVLRPGVWYRVECARQGDELVISVSRIAPDGSTRDVREKSVSSEVGAIFFPATTPLALGGKVSSPRTMVGAADQFNGAIARAFVGSA